MSAVVALTLWALIAAGLLVSNHRFRRFQDSLTLRITGAYPACIPVPAPLTPPFSQTLPDPSWFAGMPVEILSDEAVHSLFDELIDMEGLS